MKRGYTALGTVLILGAIFLLLGLGISLSSINQMQMGLSTRLKENAIAITEACIEDALIKLNKNNSLPSSIILPQGTCQVTTNSQVGTSWDFTITNTTDVYTKSVNIKLNRGSTISISTWQEQ